MKAVLNFTTIAFLLLGLLGWPRSARANDIQVSNVSLLNKNTSAGANNVANFVSVQFDLSWKNSWRMSTGPSNWDAAWVFIKFRVGASNPSLTGASSSSTTVTVSSTANLRAGMPVRVTAGTGAFATNTVITSITNSTQFVVSTAPTTALSGATVQCTRIWEHALLNNTGHTAASGTTIDAGLQTPGSAFNSTTNPAVGVFVYRNADGKGDLSLSSVQLRWNYGASTVTDAAEVDIQVFAIEMVYVPQGSFSVGSGGTETNSFTAANSTAGNTTTFLIGSTAPTIQGNNASSSASNLSARGGLDLGLNTTTATLATGYPTGFNAFYCMKYELSQGMYRDFLNSLTREQQASRVWTVCTTGTTSITNRYVMTNTSAISNDNGIRCDATVDANAPITFYCDYDGDGIPNESADGEWLAANYAIWTDQCAFLDWAGLRPMTELEFEKSSRGTLTPVADEYVWGTGAIASGAYTYTNGGQSSEGIATGFSVTAGNAVYANTVGKRANRAGIFAANSNNTGRVSAGASFYGIMEMSGNMREILVTVGNAAGRSFTGVHGNGLLHKTGDGNVDFWPGINGNGTETSANTAFSGTTFTGTGVTSYAGSGDRGGMTGAGANTLKISWREFAGSGSGNQTRDTWDHGDGIRGVRTQ